VTFSPQTTGAVTAALTFASNAQSSTTVETLTGTGTAAPPVHSVNLSWSTGTSSNVSGYNIYRAAYASACGSFSKINSLLNTGTLYTDSAVVDSATYCYATTAVNTSNEESGYSNVVSNVQVPIH
jgi:fibronectin type 3 domain-containing protein